MDDSERLIKAGERPQGTFDSVFRPIIAEFVGVCLFVFVGCLALNSGNVVGAALGHGFTIALLIAGLGEISGGHFNPAVTLGVTLSGALSPLLAVGYFLAQVVGAVLGASFVRVCLAFILVIYVDRMYYMIDPTGFIVSGTLPSTNYSTIAGGTHQLGPGIEPGWAILMEAILTTVLVFTVLMTAVNSQTQTKLAPLAIGLAVAVDIMAAGPLTGASMNPARAIGPALVASAVIDNAWSYHYIYWVGPVCGAVVSALLYRSIFASPSVRWFYRLSVTEERSQPNMQIFTVESVELEHGTKTPPHSS